MKIGISIGYKALDTFSAIFNGYHIEHVQVGGLPADVNATKSDFLRLINKFRAANPNIDISFHAYPFNLAERVEAVRNIWIDFAEKTISLASEIGAVFVNFHLGYGVDSGKRTQHEELLDGLIPVLSKLTEKGASNNVEIHIENLYPEHRNSDFCKFGDRVSDFRKIFDNIDSPMLKLCYDYGHGNLEEHGIYILRNFSSRLGSIHGHDNDQLTDIHWPIGNRDLGTIDWDSEIQLLDEIDYRGAFILENYTEDQLKSLSYLRKLGIV